ncbi:MAG: MbtH family NRPS accessory protein [Azospirillaceae bacterium]|nr:MbtH family NRPS accessory protein [Azospirillaceae bacterium]
MDGTRESWQDGTVQVVVNDEGQYALWPAHRAPPAGWHKDGPSGDRRTCLDHIATVWTDLRPLSAR